jgi:cytochrome c-type biogenesis protein CcsB
MEKFSKSFFSMRMMALAMLVFLLAIAAGTFLEAQYDIQTAKIIVYNAKWFEILLIYLGLNLIANIIRYQMFQRAKMAMLSFHLSFIIILIGAGVTRYYSFEGLMKISEGKQSDFIYSSDPMLWLKINDGKLQMTYSEKVFMSPQTNNDFSIDLNFPNHKNELTIEYVDFKKKMIDSLVMNDSIKGSALEIITEGMKSNFLTKGNFLLAGEVAISFEKKDAMPGIQLFEKNGKVMMQSKMPLRYLPMAEMQKARQSGQPVPDEMFTAVPADSIVPFYTTTLYQVNNQQIVFKQAVPHAKMMLMPSGNKKVGADYLTVKVSDGAVSKLVQLKGGMGEVPEHVVFNLNGLTYEMEYGSTKIPLPFAIACRDFQLDRYPGSEAPSSFASEVTIVDQKNNYKRNQRIFMNHVMDYQGFRFFQSAYDLDDPKTPENEEGTRLSVNADWWGTNITYLGYLLMTIGMVLSLFAPTGRFKELNDLLKKSREKREALLKLLVLLISLSGFSMANAQDNHDHASAPSKAIFRVISKEHSDELANLLVQNFEGRIAPFHTLCDEFLRKIHRKNKFENYNAVQTIMSMHMYPQHWMIQKIIQVPSNLRAAFQLKGEYASFQDLADRQSGQFKLLKEYQLAFQRMESKRNEFDKKLIKVAERFQVVESIFTWQNMKIIPLKGDAGNKWYVPLTMELMQKDSVSSQMALKYIAGLDKAAKSGSYSKVSASLKELIAFQRATSTKIVPSETAVKIEVSYNKMTIFKNAMNSYLVIGFVLLVLFFIRIFVKPSEKSNKRYNVISKLFTALLIVIFVYHGVGLGFRWYISGHAPWSNGYEAIIFIGWVTMIAGFLFAKKNPVILAGTAILAFLMIFVSEMNLLDPEITPLQPVLKSYWLMIHVAIITGSYGFLGLGAILGFFNLTLYLFRNQKNGQIVTLNINEITYVSEMTITIGLFMLTIGTFLGGIWANESWGRYWGWDPKETWALVSVLVYAVILHLRYIPALKGKFLFNAVSLWGYTAILFTFFGVNFYLVGLHSYAQGDGLGTIPNGIWIATGLFVVFTVVAAVRNHSYAKKMKANLIND